MNRDLSGLAARRFDLIVVGGGIYGICAAREAARRGLVTCLLERDDFGGATSFNSLKIIHGGLRYLQHGDLRRMRESIGERRLLMRLAPRLIHPLRCILPTEGHGLRGRAALRVALAINDLVGFDRDRGLPATHHLPRGRILARADVAALLPGLPTARVTGAAEWHDCMAASTERLAMAFLRSGVDAGLACANYAEVVELVERGGRATGVVVADRLNGTRVEIAARFVVNAAGPWVDTLLARVRGRRPPLFPPSKAVNLVTRRLFDGYAVGLTSGGSFRDPDAVLGTARRTFFVVPWQGHSLIGTRHFPVAAGAPTGIGEEDVTRFLAEINAGYPPADLTRDDVRAVYSGVLPCTPGSSGDDVRLLKRPVWRDHRDDGLDGAMSVVGVKWTTARLVAQRTLDLVTARLGEPRPAPPEAPLPGGETIESDRAVPAPLAGLVSESSVRHLWDRYGTIAADILALAAADPALARPLDPTGPHIGAEVVHGVRREMARRLTDVVLRRAGLGAVEPPSAAALKACAALMGTELGWTDERRREELERVAVAHKELGQR